MYQTIKVLEEKCKFDKTEKKLVAPTFIESGLTRWCVEQMRDEDNRELFNDFTCGSANDYMWAGCDIYSNMVRNMSIVEVLTGRAESP